MFLLLCLQTAFSSNTSVPAVVPQRNTGTVHASRDIDRRDQGRPRISSDALRVLSTSELGVEFELVLDSFQLIRDVDGVAISAVGADRMAQPGEPDLPGRVILAGIPQEAEVTVSADAADVEVFSGISVRQATGFTEQAPSPEPQAASLNWAELTRIDIVRGVRVAFIRLSPVRYYPEERLARAAHRLRVAVTFSRPGRDLPRADRFDPILEQALINGALAKDWKLPEAGMSRAGFGDTANFYARSDVWCKVKIETTGIYRITPAELSAAGFTTAGIDPGSFRLYTLGPHTSNEYYPDTMVEVPLYVTGEEDGSFDKNDYLAFYAKGTSYWDSAHTVWRQNLLTDYRYFWLTWGGSPGRRMQTISAAGAGNPVTTARAYARVEQDVECPARSGLLWLWQKYFKQTGASSAMNYVEFTLPGRTRLIEVSGRFYSANPENEYYPHYCRLYLNGVLLDSLVMTARASAPPPSYFLLDSLPLAVAERQAGTPDTLTVEIYGDPEMTDYLDYLQAKYVQELNVSSARPFVGFFFEDSGAVEFAVEGASGDVLLWDVTDDLAPRRLVDTEVSGSTRRARVEVSGIGEFCCALPSNARSPLALEQRWSGRLRGSVEEADYYVVCPDEYDAAARLFAAFRDGNLAGIPNARVQAVKLSDIYDDYTFGMEEPGAIQRFFADKQPSYGLLAGDATYDYRNRLGLEKPPGVPAFEIGYDIDPEVYGQTAKAYDAWYADFEGRGGAPDMILGRITCRSAVELRQFLDKVRNYENQPLGFWAKRFLLLADDEWLGSPGRRDPISVSSHVGGCENIMLYTRGLLDPVKVYLTEYPFTGVNDKAGARTELLRRLNQGALLWCFFGHGAGFQLCHERALYIGDVPQVENEGRNPLAFFGSCGVGRFEDTKYEAIAEELVRKQSACIATFGATKATTPGANEQFARTLFAGLVQDPEQPVGPSFFHAWLNYDIYHMFGDPGTKLRLPAQGFEPVVTPDTFHPGAAVAVLDSAPVEKGMYGISARELDWFRIYSSEGGSVNYVLPGYQLYSAPGSFSSGRLECAFVVPRLDYPDTVVVPNGRYIRQANTASVSLLCWDEEAGYSSVRNTIALGDTAAVQDTSGPQIALLADGRPLVPGDTAEVPKDPTLEGVLSDPSGILVASVPDYGLSLYVGDRTSGRIDLLPYFAYDKNSATTGRFSCPVTVSSGLDSLTLVVSDNLRNRRVATCYVSTEPSDALRIESGLVYPNPASGPAYFCFELPRAAFVTVKIYSISGRFVRRLPEQPCVFGYNQVEWDGRDEFGAVPANGVYLYKIDARAAEAGVAQSSASFRDKFLIQR